MLGRIEESIKIIFLRKKGIVLKNRLPNFFDKMLKGLRDKMLGYFKKGLGMKPPQSKNSPFDPKNLKNHGLRASKDQK